MRNMRGLFSGLVASREAAPAFTEENVLDLPPDGEVENDATSYGVMIENAQVLSGMPYWRAVRIHHLTPEENNFKQNIYVDIVDETGKRIQGAQAQVSWSGGQQVLTLDKATTEWGAHFPMWKYQVCSLIALGPQGENLASDTVTGLHTGHKDEGEGNRWFHHSFSIVFQRAVANSNPIYANSMVQGTVENGSGLTVVLLKDGKSILQTTIDEDEIFRFSDLTPGKYRVRLEGTEIQSDELEMNGLNTATISLKTTEQQLTAQSSVGGRVINGAGKTIELHQGGEVATWAPIGSDERYVFTALPEGTYQLAVASTSVVSNEFVLDGKNSLSIDLQVPAAGNGNGTKSRAIEHYVLFGPLNSPVGQVNWQLAIAYLQTFGLTAGTRPEDAKFAQRVTIIGSGAGAPSDAVEKELTEVGCDVERVEGTAEDIAAELERRVRYGQA